MLESPQIIVEKKILAYMMEQTNNTFFVSDAMISQYNMPYLRYPNMKAEAITILSPVLNGNSLFQFLMGIFFPSSSLFSFIIDQ